MGAPGGWGAKKPKDVQVFGRDRFLGFFNGPRRHPKRRDFAKPKNIG